MQDLKNIIESLLFVAEDTLTIEKIRAIVDLADNKAIRNALQELSDEYEARGGGFYLSEVAGGYQLRSRADYNEYIKRFLQPAPYRLSRAALETLAAVAYRQPIIRADIEHIRGVDCGAMLRQLMERKLIRVLGRKEIPGRPLIYATTKTFLELFELKDLSELPSPAEIEQMSAANLEVPDTDSRSQTGESDKTPGQTISSALEEADASALEVTAVKDYGTMPPDSPMTGENEEQLTVQDSVIVGADPIASETDMPLLEKIDDPGNDTPPQPPLEIATQDDDTPPEETG